MKKFLAKVAAALAFCLLVTVAMPILVDPYNVFHAKALRDNGVGPNRNYIKMTHVLAEPERYDAFIFGSSRVGSLHPEVMEGISCYNMTYNVGLPAEHLANLRTMLAHGVKPKTVYVGLDNVSYTVDPAIHLSDRMSAPYEYSRAHPVKFWGLYLNASVVVQAIPTLLHPEPMYASVQDFYDYGWWYDYDTENPNENWDNPRAVTGSTPRLAETIDELGELAALCAQHDIELVFFTNPMYEASYRAAVDEQEFKTFLRQLVRIAPFYNFAGLNDITTDRAYFVDHGHVKAGVGDRMLARMTGGEADEALLAQGFGAYVTAENVEDVLARMG